MSNQQERVEIDIQEDINLSQRTWLVAKLDHESGIIGTWFEGGNHHRLTVRYERDHFSHITLLATIREHGFHGKIVSS